MFGARDLVDQIFDIVTAVFVTFLAVEVVNVITLLGHLRFMFLHSFYRSKALIASFERALNFVSHDSKYTDQIQNMQG